MYAIRSYYDVGIDRLIVYPLVAGEALLDAVNELGARFIRR